MFKALADPTRRAILDELTQREGRYKFHHLDTAPLRKIADRWSMPEREGER